LAASPIAAAATPKKILKITICNISLLAIASNMLFGKTCSIKIDHAKSLGFPHDIFCATHICIALNQCPILA